MIPEGWQYKSLNELLDRVIDYRGQSVPKSEQGIPLITARNVRKGYLDFSTREYVDENKFNDWMKRGKPMPGDILFTTEAPLGNVCRYPESGEYAVAQRTVTLRTNEKLESEFLLHALLSEYGQRVIDLHSSGSTAKGIKSSELKKVKLAVPSSTQEQKKIAQILSTWDKTITTTEQLLANSQKQKKALMQQLLTGKKRLLDENGVRFCGEWRAYKFEELFNERIETKRDDLPLLSITSDNGVIYQNESGRKNTSNEDKSKYRRICINDIGYNTMRMWQGRSCLSDKEGIVSPAYTILIPSKQVIPAYAAYLFKLPRLVHVFYRHSQGLVSDTWNLKFSNFKKITWLFPRLDEQRKIAQLLRNADKEVSILVDKIDALRQEKKALMQQLLTGKRRVKVDKDAA